MNGDGRGHRDGRDPGPASIGLDTNVLVRYLVRDHPGQAAAATRLIESECTADSPGIVTLVVLCELVWIFERGYRHRRGEIAGVLRSLLGAQEIRVERSDLARQALNGYEDGSSGFADFVVGLSAREEGVEWTWTFDRKAAGSARFKLIGSTAPRSGARKNGEARPGRADRDPRPRDVAPTAHSFERAHAFQRLRSGRAG